MNESSPLSKKPFFLNTTAARTTLVYCIAAAALAWVFHDVNLSGLKKDFFNIVWPLAILGMAVDIGRYITQSIRWNLLLRPFGKISVFKTFQALYAGIFLNLILPLRVGEVARAYLASRFAEARFPGIVSSMVVEYLFDGIWFSLGIGLVALFVPFTGQMAGAARVLGVLVIAAIGIFIFFLFYKRNVESPDSAPPRSLAWKPVWHAMSFLRKVRKGFQVIGVSRRFWFSFAISALDIVFHIIAFWILMHAYGIHLPLIVATAVLLFIFVGLIIPNAPSNVGSFQFLCVLGLLAFGVDKTTAGGFSVFFFVIVNIPQVVIGGIAFMRSGEKLNEIRAHIASLRLSNKE
jgi:glycosyltransferase 2 family protein